MSENRKDSEQKQNGGQAAEQASSYSKWDLTTWKDLMTAIQSFATIIALVLGGWWTYKIFVLEREVSPHANVSQVVAGEFIAPKWYLIQIYITAQNTGKSLVKFDAADIRVAQITPLPQQVEEIFKTKSDPVSPTAWDLPWPIVCRYQRPFPITRLEAGESETAEVEFVIPAWLQTVRIYTYLQNTSTDNGWLKWLKWLKWLIGRGEPETTPGHREASVNGNGWRTITIYNLQGNGEDEKQAMAKLLPDNDRVCASDGLPGTQRAPTAGAAATAGTK